MVENTTELTSPTPSSSVLCSLFGSAGYGRFVGGSSFVGNEELLVGESGASERTQSGIGRSPCDPPILSRNEAPLGEDGLEWMGESSNEGIVKSHSSRERCRWAL